MKKILTVCVVIAASLFVSTSVNAQTKIGYFDEQQILAMMPGIAKVDTLIQKFAQDSLAPERDQLVDDLKKLDSLLKDSTHLSKSLQITLQKEAAEKYYKLQNWQQYQQQVLAQKQEQLLAPFKKPVYIALQEVIAEQKYTAVLKPESIIFLDKSEELPLRVLAKLKLPNLPKEIQEQIDALNASNKATTPSGSKAPATQGNKPKGKG